jgi:dihydrofolate reductase
MIKLIAALDLADGIGKNGSIPWRAPEDMRRFRALTMGCPIIMGRKTIESLTPGRLKGRDIVSVGSTGRFKSVKEAIDALAGHDTIWIGGGVGVYKEALDLGAVDELHLTRVMGWFDCDARFPAYVSHATIPGYPTKPRERESFWLADKRWFVREREHFTPPKGPDLTFMRAQAG